MVFSDNDINTIETIKIKHDNIQPHAEVPTLKYIFEYNPSPL